MAVENSWNSTKLLATAVGSGVVLVAVAKFVRRIFAEKPKEYPKDVVILFQVPRRAISPNLSPFAIKLETYLRMAKIPYQNEYSRKMSPKSKTPWIMLNGKVYSDSQFIIEFLNKEFNVNLSKHLTPKEKAVARSMFKMSEESLYWAFILSRWVYSYGDPTILNIAPFNRYILWRIKFHVARMCYYQGYGRHTEAEVETICRQDLKALSDHLGDNPYLMGNQPCEEDCAVFGMLAMMWMMPETAFAAKIVQENVYPNVTAYFERMKNDHWPDYELQT